MFLDCDLLGINCCQNRGNWRGVRDMGQPHIRLFKSLHGSGDRPFQYRVDYDSTADGTTSASHLEWMKPPSGSPVTEVPIGACFVQHYGCGPFCFCSSRYPCWDGKGKAKGESPFLGVPFFVCFVFCEDPSKLVVFHLASL